ncbi:MAG TPA: methionine--tRNA ligase, partial [Acidimicrobiia bacterium]|nr:methionine--tRNA ligase [Acidimicrobiia bacterium]
PFVARNATRFVDLAGRLDISFDDFIRTSADPRHRPVVEEIWRRSLDNGDLYRATYAGWYCAGCEAFVDGACDEHDTPLEHVEEENWYFRLSRYAPVIRERIESGALRIAPAERANEVLGFLAGEVRDISVSRSRARARDWGIPVPGDDGQIVYVWFDALVNYLSAAGFERWDAARVRRHVIGKGIVRFHAVIWPAILLAAGVRLPDELFVHDYVTAAGRKIGKSLGNVVDPGAIVDRYGADTLRWWLLREVPRVGETDFSEERLVDTANRDLANGIGNLVQRVVTLAARDGIGGGVPSDDAWPLIAVCHETRTAIDAAFETFDLRAATGALCDLVGAVNRYVEHEKPWTLPPDARGPVLATALHATRVVADELTPFAPTLAGAAAARLGRAEGPVVPGPPLFGRLEAAKSTA